MLGSPSAGELTAAGSEMKSRGFQNRSELGKEHFPGELGSLAADQVVCEAIMCAAESTAQHSHFAAKPHHSPSCLYQSSLSPAWLILWDRMCSESYYSPGKESPLINYLKDSAWLLFCLPTESLCIPQLHVGPGRSAKAERLMQSQGEEFQNTRQLVRLQQLRPFLMIVAETQATAFPDSLLLS